MPAMSSAEKKADIERYHRELQERGKIDLVPSNTIGTVLIPGDNTKAKQILSTLEAGEPYFVFRAKDLLSLFALDAYAVMVEKYGGQTEQMESLVKMRAEFLEWQRANPGKVKLPD